jgi:serine phosphatase RsbU (regulator of sigma subunit)
MLGAMPWHYTTITTELHPGDLLFLYTDGLVERRDADLDERIGRLTAILQDSSMRPDLALDEVMARMEFDRAADDTTLFALHIE